MACVDTTSFASNASFGNARQRVPGKMSQTIQMSECLLGSQISGPKDLESLVQPDDIRTFEASARHEKGSDKRSWCWLCASFCQWINSTFLHDPSTQGVKVKGLGENPFHKELVHGESFRYGLNDLDDDPTIRIQMKRVVNPYFRGFCAFFTACLSELYFRFMYVIFTSETRLAMTDQGRILIWSHDVRGQNTTLRQMILKMFMTRGTFALIMFVLSVVLLGEFIERLLDYDIRYYNIHLAFACLAFIILKCCQALFIYAKRRIRVQSQTQMRSFLATDLCATSFMLQHSHGFFGKHTTSEVRLFFGRYPQVEDMCFAGRHLRVSDVGLVETNPSIPTAGGDGHSSVSESRVEKSQSWWLSLLAIASTIVYFYGAGQWIYSVVIFSIGNEHQRPHAPDTVGFVADFALFVLATKAWLDMRASAMLNQKPIIRIMDKFQSSISTTSTDSNFPHYISEIEGFLSAMVGLAVEQGRGFRAVPAQTFLRHFGHKKHTAHIFSGRRWRDIDTMDDTIRTALINSEILHGDGLEKAFKKYSQFVSLLDGEVIVAVYPNARQNRLRRRIFSCLTFGLYYLLWKFLFPHVHGAVIVTNARIIQVSICTKVRFYSIKVDTFVVDDSVQTCTVDVPHPLPCTWRHGESKVQIATRLGELQLRLPKTHWYHDCMLRTWQALSMVTAQTMMVQKSHDLQMPEVDPREYKIIMRWLHLAVVARERLELRVLWAQQYLSDEDCTFIEMIQLAPTVKSRAFVPALSVEPPKVFLDLGSLSHPLVLSGHGFAVSCWLRFPEVYRLPFMLQVNSASVLICVLWFPKRPRQKTRFPDQANVSLPSSAASLKSAIKSSVFGRGDEAISWPEGLRAGWKALGDEWIPPSLSHTEGITANFDSMCFSLEVFSPRLITIPERPYPSTFFGGPALWDIEIGGGQDKFRFSRAADEEVLWSAGLVHERPDFLWMKVPIPALIQEWTITSRRLIALRVEPLTKMQQLVRRCALCFASPPRQTIHFIPMSTVAGFVAEEVFTLEDSCINRFRRRVAGRNPADQTVVSIKLLTRYGAKRSFPEGAALSQLIYLEPSEGVESDSTLDSKLYSPVIKELRAWGTAMKLAFDNDAWNRVIHLIPAVDADAKEGCERGWQPRVSMARGGAARRRFRSLVTATKSGLLNVRKSLPSASFNQPQEGDSATKSSKAAEHSDVSDLSTLKSTLLGNIAQMTFQNYSSASAAYRRLQQVCDEISLDMGDAKRAGGTLAPENDRPMYQEAQGNRHSATAFPDHWGMSAD